MNLTEKHEPQTLGEIVGQPTHEIRKRLNGRDTPDFLLFGPPGTGKTTAARCISNELQQSESGYVEMNAADTGVEEVRSRVDKAARQLTLMGEPPVVVLDEMETMGYQAQQSLKKRVSDYPAVFILITNDTSLDKINDALIDRCKLVEFGSVNDAAIKSRLLEIADREDMDLSEQKAESIAAFSNGSVRTAVQKLEDERAPTNRQTDGWGDTEDAEDLLEPTKRSPEWREDDDDSSDLDILDM